MLCECGCGLEIEDAPHRKYYKARFRPGHNGRLPHMDLGRSGICKCGCGQKTAIAVSTCRRFNTVKGQPLEFVRGHNRRGAQFSKDHCEKISKAKAGIPKTPEHIEKLSKALKKHPSITGPVHWNWKGGSPQRRSTSDMFWCRAIKRRDNYTCQQCGHKSRNRMHAHHIKPYVSYPELRLKLSNGVTLCEPCHRAIHGLTPKADTPPRYRGALTTSRVLDHRSLLYDLS